MFSEAKKKVPDADITQASYYGIPYPEESFDHVTATNALSGDSIYAKKVLLEMLRVCRGVGMDLYCRVAENAERYFCGTIGDMVCKSY